MPGKTFARRLDSTIQSILISFHYVLDLVTKPIIKISFHKRLAGKKKEMLLMLSFSKRHREEFLKKNQIIFVLI